MVSGAAASPSTAREYPFLPRLARYGLTESLSEAAFEHLVGPEIDDNRAPAPVETASWEISASGIASAEVLLRSPITDLEKEGSLDNQTLPLVILECASMHHRNYPSNALDALKAWNRGFDLYNLRFGPLREQILPTCLMINKPDELMVEKAKQEDQMNSSKTQSQQ
uniref:Uncharacterized protein n=1 Tax=Romanomermis culicivorax TaxID=13658 RepID=A0A915L4W5_ROMCU